MRDYLHHHEGGQKFCKQTHKKVLTIKEKIDKLDLTNIDNFCLSKMPIRKWKRQAMEWEKVFIIHFSGKGQRTRKKYIKIKNQ